MRSIEPVALGAQNAKLRRLRRLSRTTKARSTERAFVVDGPVLVADAIRSPLAVQELFAAPAVWDSGQLDQLLDQSADQRPQCYSVEQSVLEAALDPVNPRPIAAVVGQPTWTMADLADDRPVLVAVELRDPGNLGTIVRTAEAAEFGGVVVVGDSVDVFSPKVVRASAGSVLRTPLVRISDAAEAFDGLGTEGRPMLAAVVDADAPSYDQHDLRRAAIVVGNEPHGLSAETIKLVQGRITIPLSPSVESLNVGAAASVLCFEAARQRRANPVPAPKLSGQ